MIISLLAKIAALWLITHLTQVLRFCWFSSQMGINGNQSLSGKKEKHIIKKKEEKAPWL